MGQGYSVEKFTSSVTAPARLCRRTVPPELFNALSMFAVTLVTLPTTLVVKPLVTPYCTTPEMPYTDSTSAFTLARVMNWPGWMSVFVGKV